MELKKPNEDREGGERLSLRDEGWYPRAPYERKGREGEYLDGKNRSDYRATWIKPW